MKKTIFLLSFISITAFSFSQEVKGIIKGSVAEESTKELMEFVNIGLFTVSDSSVIAGIVSDKNGAYVFNDVKEGNYFVEISFIGFEKVNTPPFSVNDKNQQIDLGTIYFRPSGQLLGDVEITAEKSYMETSIDKKTYNVDQDLMSSSGSASQVLENIPSVAVDIDGKVSLRGLSNVTILINGRPSALMKTNSAAALQQIPANTIERIEIITNPSAKYKPEGTGGIINIVLKKETKQGLVGSITANAGLEDRYNSTLILNYNPGKINIYGSYGFRQDYRNRTSDDYREIKDSATGILINDFNVNSTAYYRPISHTANFGIDYDINDKNTIGASVDYFYTNFLRTENTNTISHAGNDSIISDFGRTRLNNEQEYDQEASAYFEHKFKKEEHTLNLEFNIVKHFEEEKNNFIESRRIEFTPTIYDNTIIRQGENAGDVTLEYVYPINEDAEFEAGLITEWFHEDFSFFGEHLDETSNTWQKDIKKSNDFLWKQDLYTVYATYSQSIEDFGFLLGVRAEQANITSNLVTMDSVVTSNYFKIYPSLHLSLETSDNSEFQLSYSKRINRPEGDEMNPFPEYDDPRFLEAGNPKLKPEQIHSIELGYQYKNNKTTFVPTLYYKYTYDAFTEISKYINDTALLTTFENLSTQQSAGLELIYSQQIKKILTINLSGNIFYDEIDASNLGYVGKKSIISESVKLGTNINITPSTVLQLNSTYRSPTLTPQGKYLSSAVLSLGLRQDIFKKKASLLLSVSDVFNSLRWTSEIDTPELYQKTTGKRRSQIFYLGFTYKFGKATKKAEDIRFDEGK